MEYSLIRTTVSSNPWLKIPVLHSSKIQSELPARLLLALARNVASVIWEARAKAAWGLTEKRRRVVRQLGLKNDLRVLRERASRYYCFFLFPLLPGGLVLLAAAAAAVGAR